jgi:hypothetical protein
MPVVVRRVQSGIYYLPGGQTQSWGWTMARGAVVAFSPIYEYTPVPGTQYLATIRQLDFQVSPDFQDPENSVLFWVRFTNSGSNTARFRLGVVTFRGE